MDDYPLYREQSPLMSSQSVEAKRSKGGGSCQKTARVALRNMRNNLCCFQRFLRPLTIALVRTEHQPGLKLEKLISYLSIVVQGLPSFPPILSPSYPSSIRLSTFDVLHTKHCVWKLVTPGNNNFYSFSCIKR